MTLPGQQLLSAGRGKVAQSRYKVKAFAKLDPHLRTPPSTRFPERAAKPKPIVDAAIASDLTAAAVTQLTMRGALHSSGNHEHEPLPAGMAVAA